MRWRGWGLVLAALATLGGLAVAGRLLDLPEDRQLLTQPPPLTTPTQVVSVATLSPPATIPAVLQRSLRLPNLRRAGSCPTTPTAGPPMTVAHPVVAVAVGNGPVYPVLFRAAPDGQLDQSAVAYWDAPKPLAGVAIVRGHRLGTPRDRIRFQNDQQGLSLIHVLDRATAYSAGPEGRWWRPTRLRAGNGYYGLQIDGPQLQRGAGGQVRLALSFAHAGGVGFGLIETWLSCCAGVAWGLGASRGASTTTGTTIATAAGSLWPAQRGEAAGGAAGGGRLLPAP